MSRSTSPRMSSEFNDDDADVVLRTVDGVDFRVYKVILAKASPFFKDMFSLPQSSRSERGDRRSSTGIPVVSVSEDHQTLDWILRFCYPLDDPEIDSLSDAHRLLGAAHKYQMESIIKRVTKLLATFVATQPLRIFAIACRYKLESLARKAAYGALRLSQTEIIDADVAEFDHISVPTFQRLLRYHALCAEAAQEVANDFRWIPSHDWVWFMCRKCPSYAHPTRIKNGAMTYYARAWWAATMKELASTLPECPDGSRIGFKGLTLPPEAQQCPTCGPACFRDMMRFFPLFREQIQLATSAVEFSPD